MALSSRLDVLRNYSKHDWNSGNGFHCWAYLLYRWKGPFNQQIFLQCTSVSYRNWCSNDLVLSEMLWCEDQVFAIFVNAHTRWCPNCTSQRWLLWHNRRQCRSPCFCLLKSPEVMAGAITTSCVPSFEYITYLWERAAANILCTRFFISRHSGSITSSWRNFVCINLVSAWNKRKSKTPEKKKQNLQGWNCCTASAFCLYFLKQMTMVPGFLLWPGCVKHCLSMGATTP